MALERSFAELVDGYRRLAEAARDLEISAVEDHPLVEEVLPVERLGDAVTQLQGIVQEGVAAAELALDAVTGPGAVERACIALSRAHERYHETCHSLMEQLASHGSLTQLADLGRRRGREWALWVAAICQTVDACMPPLHEVGAALLGCWNEVVEHGGTYSLPVRTRVAGQRALALVPDETAEDVK